ncbi:MAG: rRNA processing protein RimM [Deltaproteobacteria bacterium]|nr:rRNA processing protein RimM [Deltaproteobacteria bacterium]
MTGERVKERLEIGGVARAHGIRGEVAIVTHDPDSVALETIKTIYIAGVEYHILEARSADKGWLVRLEGIPTRTEAEGLRGKPVEVDRAALGLVEGEVLLDDLVGCKVVLPDGSPWGTIVEIEGGFQDLLVIHDGELERLLPLVDEFVKTIDTAAGIVTVDPPEGLPTSPVVRR